MVRKMQRAEQGLEFAVLTAQHFAQRGIAECPTLEQQLFER